MTDQGFSGKSKVTMMGTCRFSLEYEDGMTHEIEIQIHFSPAITTILKLKEPRQGRNLCLIQHDQMILTLGAGKYSKHLMLKRRTTANSSKVGSKILNLENTFKR